MFHLISPSTAERRLWPLAAMLVCLVASSGNAQAGPIDQMQSEALALEKSRDCEGAYKKYEELKQHTGSIKSVRNRQRLEAFIATKLARLLKCYTACTPTEQEKQYLDQAKDYAEKKQQKRAYRILARLLRRKNPKCKSWAEGLALMKTLSSGLKIRRHHKSVDPCDISPETKAELTTLGENIQKLETKINTLQQDEALPAPPNPPRWARKSRKGGRYYKRWYRNWKRRTERKMRRNRYRYELQRLTKLQATFRDIRDMRERVWKHREDFQSCDQVYTALKTRGQSLKKAETSAYNGIVELYSGRVKRMTKYMNYYAGRYRKLRKNQKTDQETIQSLQTTLQRQQEFIDNVTQDLVLLSNMLVFKRNNPSEGTLLQNSMGNFQELMGDQKKLFAAIQKRYPQYLQSADGRKQLQTQLASLERFEKVLERFSGKQTGDKAEKINQTLQSVRASIALLEKADKELANKPTLAGPKNSAAALQAPVASAQTPGRSSWGWIFLLIGVGLIGGASFYLWREKQKRASI